MTVPPRPTMPAMSATPPPGVSAQLRQQIYYHLDNGFLENAFFLAGRLSGVEPRNPESSHLLATCSLRLGRYKAAFDYAKHKNHHLQHLGCAYVFAQACLALERHELGVQALEKARGQWGGRSHWNKHSDTSRRHIPDAAACSCLLGKLWSAHGDIKKAVEHYTEALRLNPFMWDAFTDLCNMGAFVRPANIYKITPEMLTNLSHSASNGTLTGAPFAVQESAGSKYPFVATPDVDPFNPSQRNGDIGLNLGGSNLLSKLNGSIPTTNGHAMSSNYPDIETPTSNGQNIPDDDIMMGDAVGQDPNEVVEIPPAPGRKARLQPFTSVEDPPKMRHITSRVRQKMSSETDVTEIPRPVGQNGHKRTVSGQSMREANPAPPSTSDPTAAPPRRSVRLLNSISSQIRPSASRLTAATSRDSESKERRELRRAKAPSSKAKAASAPQTGRAVSGSRKPTVEISDASSKPESRPPPGALMRPPPPSKAPVPVDFNQEKEALEWLLDLFQRFGTGYSQIGRFQCAQALETFMAIPTAQRETPWVLAQIGKAYYERSRFVEAEKMFMRIRDKVPSYMEDMEVFSNVLWQLKKDTELAYLAHTLMDQDRLSPQAWCAIGNAFSLQREHDQAIKCFARATQLDPKFAYAFTLQGHEHVTNEEYDKALSAYRRAIAADSRHYNGWYGLGQVYEKMGKYEIAERHYRSAAHINPTNALLAVKIGSVLDRMRKTQPALMQYMTAVALDPRSNLARFRKAQIHLKLNAPLDALKDLEHLKDSAPDDADVHFLLGRTYKILGQRANAVRHFTIALNLDPKAQPWLKKAMESLSDDDGEDWSEGDEADDER